MTSSNGNFFYVTGPLYGDSPVTGEFPSQRSVTQSFDVFFDLCLNKRLRKQSRRRWFETPSCSLWRHCDEMHFALTATYHDIIQEMVPVRRRHKPSSKKHHFYLKIVLCYQFLYTHYGLLPVNQCGMFHIESMKFGLKTFIALAGKRLDITRIPGIKINEKNI